MNQAGEDGWVEKTKVSKRQPSAFRKKQLFFTIFHYETTNVCSFAPIHTIQSVKPKKNTQGILPPLVVLNTSIKVYRKSTRVLQAGGGGRFVEFCKPRSAAYTQEGSFHDIFQSDIVERGEETECWKVLETFFFLQHFNIFSHASRTRSPKNDSRFSRFTSQSSPKDLSQGCFKLCFQIFP